MDNINTKEEESSAKIKSILNDVKKKKVKKRQDVIYGVYDNTNASIFKKIDDFLIDNTRVGLKEKAYFFHLMAVMIDAGIPVLQTLKILANKTENLRFQRVINTIVYSASGGKSLADSMARFPEVFSEAELGVVRAGEAAGNLNKMLFRLAYETEKSHELQSKLISAATYPIIILITLIAIMIGMIVWIVPTLTNLLIEGGMTEQEFPFATKLLLGMSAGIQNYWWLIILILLFLYGIYSLYKSTEVGKFQLDYLKLRLPVIGGLLRKVIVLRFISLLGILNESGLPVIKTLQIIGGSSKNALYRTKIFQIIKNVQAGERISDNLTDSPFLFPEAVTQMLNIGEVSASVGSISKKIAVHYDREIDHSLRRLTSLFEPIMILFVGLVVALLALAILMPIFDLTTLV